MKYNVCGRCGAHLDFGERCECSRDNAKEAGDEKEKREAEAQASRSDNDAVRN